MTISDDLFRAILAMDSLESAAFPSAPVCPAAAAIFSFGSVIFLCIALFVVTLSKLFLTFDSYNRGDSAGIVGLGGVGTSIGNATARSVRGHQQ